jgi:hypothetical protein
MRCEPDVERLFDLARMAEVEGQVVKPMRTGDAVRRCRARAFDPSGGLSGYVEDVTDVETRLHEAVSQPPAPAGDDRESFHGHGADPSG